MLKLLIADDERVICETVATIIDWEKYNIEIIGSCLNGLEAYDIIIDEAPEIVITDVRMPGLSGLELIKRVTALDINTQFILISGFCEFEYAQEAMQYGVKHYLLKPCNETHIIDAVQKCIKEYCENQQTQQIIDSKFETVCTLRGNMFLSILNDALSHTNYDTIFSTYEPYMDFHTIPYRIFYIYYLEQKSIKTFLSIIKQYFETNFPTISIYGVYVRNTFLLFVQDYSVDYNNLISAFKKIHWHTQTITPDIKTESFPDLYALLISLLSKVTRYGTIYYMNRFHLVQVCNYNAITKRVEALYNAYKDGNKNARTQLIEILNNIADITFFRQLTSSLLFKIIADNPALPRIDCTNWLLHTEQEYNLDKLKENSIKKLKELLMYSSDHGNLSTCTLQICQCIAESLDDPNLTLKKIAEKSLFMNVDYVSKKFQKEMNIKFSKYLTNKRIQRAKEYFDDNPSIKIQDVADKIGFSNNPQYFSQLFKKNTGMTPSAYVTSLKD